MFASPTTLRKQYSLKAIPSLPLPTATAPIIVQGTGPVDNEYYPIYNRSQDDNEYPNKIDTNCIEDVDIDYLNNDDDLLYEMDEDDYNESITVPHATEKYRNLSETVKPYFKNNDVDEGNEQLWVNGATVYSEEKANDTIIFDASKELQIGDKIKFKSNVYNYLYSKNQMIQREGIVTEFTHQGSIRIATDTNDVCFSAKQIEKLDVVRIQSAKKNLNTLFKLKTHSEKDEFARYLKSLLKEQSWLTIYTISEFVTNKRNIYRNVYMDLTAFEVLVKKQYARAQTSDLAQKSCSMCTMLNAFDNEWCCVCNTQFNDPFAEIHLYHDEICKLSHRDHRVFPENKQRHKMYTKEPFLPYIPSDQRCHIDTIRTRLKIALKQDTNLYKYQLYTVLWAYCVERAIISKQMLCVGSNDLRFTNRQCDVYCIQKQFIPSDIERVIPPRMVSFGGGIISDDVGLGKTLTMLSLIASHPFNDDITSNSFSSTNHKPKYGATNQTLRCAATLLIAPSHLIEQWKNEAAKHFKKDIFNIITITTESDHKNISYADVLQAQIVMVSSQFIGGTNYKFARMPRSTRDIHPFEKHWNCLDPILPHHMLNLNETSVFFELLHFERIILDEGHEYIDLRDARDVILSIESQTKWFLTATPFANDNSIGTIADFLKIEFDDKYYDKVNWNENIDKALGYTLHCIIYNHLFSRHTKDSIMDDNHLPDIDEKAEFVMFHPIERVLYDLIDSRPKSKNVLEKLRRTCSGVFTYFLRDNYNFHYRFYLKEYLLSTNKTYLTKLFEINKRYYPLQINTIRKELKEITKKLKKAIIYKQRVDDKKEEFKNKGIKFDLSLAFPNEIREKYERIDVKWRSLQRQKDKMEGELIRNHKENEIIQNVFMDREIEEYKMKFKNKNDLLLYFAENYGAKQTAILECINTLYNCDKNNRIIVFSLFSSTLNALQKHMKQMGLSAVSCQGNVHQRKKAMSSFQCVGNTDNRIMLLSIQNAASGADLNQATHVLLVDPVPGSFSESFAEERQAVGRAVRQGMSNTNPTKVIRFVIDGTIEHDIFIRNQKYKSSMESETNRMCLMKLFKNKRNLDEIMFYMNIKDASFGNKSRKRALLSNECDEDNIDEFRPLKKRKIQRIAIETESKSDSEEYIDKEYIDNCFDLPPMI